MSPSRYAAPGNKSTRTRHCLLLMALVLGGFCAHADTVKLKDGTVLEGDITTEDDATLSIYLEFSGGTITQTRQINKADVAGVIRWTPEQKAAWQAKRDYQSLQKYRLNPKNSYAVGDYDQIINDVFRRFLTEHPDSIYASNVTERIVEWKAERDLVAAGNVKFRRRWSPAAEVAPLIERERGQQLLQQAHALISQHRFEPAFQRLQLVVHMDGQPELVAQAKPLLASVYQSAVNLLDQQQQQLEGDVSAAQQRVDQARQALSAAETSLAQVMSSEQSLRGSTRDTQGAPSDQAMGGGLQSTVQAQIAVNKARSELNAAQNHLEYAKSLLDVVRQKLTTLKSQALGVAASTLPPQASKGQPAPSTPAGSPDVLVGLVAWAKNNWLGMVIVLFAILFLLSRFIKD